MQDIDKMTAYWVETAALEAKLRGATESHSQCMKEGPPMRIDTQQQACQNMPDQQFSERLVNAICEALQSAREDSWKRLESYLLTRCTSHEQECAALQVVLSNENAQVLKVSCDGLSDDRAVFGLEVPSLNEAEIETPNV